MKPNLEKKEGGITGMHSGITGDLTGIRGDLTGITGNLDTCEITDEERKKGINITELIKKQK